MTAAPRKTGRTIGLVLLAATVLFGLFGPMLIAADPARQNLSNTMAPPSAAWLLGTDHLGRSVLARMAAATRLSLELGAAAVLVSGAIGIAIGLLAAWLGGRIDTALTATADAVLALPGLLLIVLVTALAPGAIWPMFGGLVLAMWVEWFRVTRAVAAARLASPAVEASRLLGFGYGYVVRHHIVPAVAPLWGALAAFGVGQAILTVGGLGFIGAGLRPPQAEWGLMMAESLPHYASLPAALLAPALTLSLVVLSLQLVAQRR